MFCILRKGRIWLVGKERAKDSVFDFEGEFPTRADAEEYIRSHERPAELHLTFSDGPVTGSPAFIVIDDTDLSEQLPDPSAE